MIQTAFVDAARPRSCCILRLPMLTYTIGHEILLLNERNALAMLPANEFDQLPINKRCAAVIRAALICCRPYSEYTKPHRWLRLWEFRKRREDHLAAAEQFRLYRFEGSTFPIPPEKEADEIANGKEEGRQLGGELLPRLIDYLSPKVQSLGYATVFDVPFGMGLHLYFTALESRGHIRIENAREKQIREEMAQHRSEIAREREEAKRKEAEPCQH